ncbi:MAG TPA: hypothetical protein VKX25_02665 [Bryobacteraceae bacterium]|jgi:hypothetical protein|nr:hypothetical protein [Bryobacteraceae bacterium]
MTNYGTRSLGTLLALVFASAACGPNRVAGAHLDPAFQKYISPDALLVADIEAAKLRQTAFFHRNQTTLGGALPASDADRVLLVWNGKGVLIAQQKAPGEPVRLSGDPALVRRSQELARSGGGNLPEELSGALASLADADQIRILLRGLPVEDLHLPSEYASLLANFRGHVRRTAVGLEAQSGLNLHARIDCFSTEGSERVDVALRAGIGFARLSAIAKDPGEARLYEVLQVKRDGSSVFIDGKYPPDLSDDLLRRILLSARP